MFGLNSCYSVLLILYLFSDGKKASAHADTPRPTKNAAGKNDKSNVKTPKSGAQVSCDSCKKYVTFNSHFCILNKINKEIY